MLDLLTVNFVTLKLIGVQPIGDWSWWIVFSPQIFSCVWYVAFRLWDDKQ